LLDRIDIQISVPAVTRAELAQATPGEASAVIQARVETARARMLQRQGKPNAVLGTREIDHLCIPDKTGAALLDQAVARLNLSARGYHRVLRLARSIADLADSETILPAHLAEAIQYRRSPA